MQKTKVSACIVVYGGGEEAAQAARSLVEHTRDAALRSHWWTTPRRIGAGLNGLRRSSLAPE